MNSNKEKVQTILLVQRSSNLDGSAFSALILADGLREVGWETHVVFGFNGPIIDQYVNRGHNVHVIKHDNWLRRSNLLHFIKDQVTEWRSSKEFDSVINQINPDMIYINTAVSLAGVLAANRNGIPCVWHLRELFDDVGGEMHAPNLLRPVVRRIFKQYATQLIANSKAVAINLLGNTGEDSAVVIPNAVEDSFFEDKRSKSEARAVFELPESKTIIGVPGTLRPMKGHQFFFNSVAPLLKDRSEIIVAVTGSGKSDYTQSLYAQVDALGIANHVHFLGTIQDMPAFYHACDIVCVPSKSEPFGRTVIESFASGTPVVGTKVGGIAEIIHDHHNGRLIPYGEEQILRNAINELLESPIHCMKIKKQARKDAEEQYHERVYKTNLMNILNEVVLRFV